MTPAASRRKAAAGSARTARQEGVGGRNAEPSSLAFFIFSWSQNFQSTSLFYYKRT